MNFEEYAALKRPIIEQIQALKRAYLHEAEPLVKRLSELERLYNGPIMIVDGEVVKFLAERAAFNTGNV